MWKLASFECMPKARELTDSLPGQVIVASPQKLFLEPQEITSPIKSKFPAQNSDSSQGKQIVPHTVCQYMIVVFWVYWPCPFMKGILHPDYKYIYPEQAYLFHTAVLLIGITQLNCYRAIGSSVYIVILFFSQFQTFLS